MIKTIYKTFILATLLASTSSCVNDWLDIAPVDGTEDTKAILSSSDLNTARIGMYQILKGNSTFRDYYAARMIYYGEVRGEDMQSDKSGSRSLKCYDFTYSTANDAPVIWQTPYLVIGRANHVIEAAESGTLSDQESAKTVIDQYNAEAKVIRAMAHFDLARVYGKTYTSDNGASLGVPVVKTVLEPGEKLARNTVAEVYDAVISDLTDAINSGALPTKVTTGYFNIWAAKALLTRVYITKGDNANALTTAEDIIKNSPYKLWTNAEYPTAWNEKSAAHSNEILFEFAITNSTDWTDREGIAYLYSESGYADIVTTKKFLDILNEDPSDIRHSLFLKPTNKDYIQLYGENPVFMNKFSTQNAPEDDFRYNDIPLLRLSEVYLNAAEAAMKENNKNKAAEYLDAIVNRANVNNHVTAADITLEKILKERRKELIGEGHRFFDAMRNNETIVRYTSEADKGWQQSLSNNVRSFDRNFYKTLLPIPENEMNANPEMVQNDGY